MGKLTRVTDTLIKFKLKAIGAVQRLLSDKLDESVSVKDFGAKGDGVTDDTLAFKLALASSSSVINVPKGVYIITDTIVMPAGKTLKGVGVDYWDTWRPADNRLFKSVKEGTHLLFKGTGPRVYSAINLAHQNPDKSNSGISYGLTHFTNQDSVAGAPATARMFSVGIIATPNNRIKDLRIAPWHEGIEGYNDFNTTSLGSDWDVGLWLQGANESVVENVQGVGYWRMAGCLMTENDGTYEQWGSNPERVRITNCAFQGVRGLLIRNGAQWKVFSNTSTTLDVEWNKTWTLTSQNKFKVAGSSVFYSFTGYTFDTSNNRVKLTGVTPSLTNNVTAIRSPSMGNNLSGSTFENSYSSSLEHSSKTSSEQLGLPIAGALEMNGYPLRGMKFINSKFQTVWDKMNTIFGDCRDMKFVACQFENGSLVAYNQTDSASGFTENLRMVNSYVNSGTLDRTLFTPREYFNDYDAFPTALTDGTFIIRPPLYNVTGITTRLLSSDGRTRAEFKDDGQDTSFRSGRNFGFADSTGSSILILYGSSKNATFANNVTVGGDIACSGDNGYVGSATQPFQGLRLKDSDGSVKLIKLVNGTITIVDAY